MEQDAQIVLLVNMQIDQVPSNVHLASQAHILIVLLHAQHVRLVSMLQLLEPNHATSVRRVM